jgi:predicted flavoprotein YhiN
MCAALPGVFCAGEMLDWEAPTGGYLLTACMSSGVRVAEGVKSFLQGQLTRELVLVCAVGAQH